MSYDLMVFDPAIAPRDREAFMAWYGDVTLWEETRDYNNPKGLTGNLPLFYDRLRATFPPMNGPNAPDLDAAPPPKTLLQKIFGGGPAPQPEINEAMLADYSCAQNAIYLAFAWSVSDLAYNRTFNMAMSAGVGFFNVSANQGEILHDVRQFEDFIGL